MALNVFVSCSLGCIHTRVIISTGGSYRPDSLIQSFLYHQDHRGFPLSPKVTFLHITEQVYEVITK